MSNPGSLLRAALTPEALEEILMSKGSFPIPDNWSQGRFHPVARHVATDTLAAVLLLQRAAASRFSATTVVARRDEDGWKPVFETSDVWRVPPSASRPEGGPGIASVGRTTGAVIAPEKTVVTVVAGVASRRAHGLQLASKLGIQSLEVQPKTGIFVGLATHASPESRAYRLIAIALDGDALDAHAFRDDPH